MIQKNWQDLIKPQRLDVQPGRRPDREATIVVEPLERGFGITLGNALRRVLLSSLQGAAITQIHKDLEHASQVSGVSLFKTLIFITLPLLFPAFAAGWIWVAVHALRAFAIPLMLAGRNNQVFAVLLWDYWERAMPVACAMGVLLILALIPLTLLLRKFISQLSRQQ